MHTEYFQQMLGMIVNQNVMGMLSVPLKISLYQAQSFKFSLQI